MPLSVILNGNLREFEHLSEGASVTELVGDMGLKADRVAVEHNGGIAARRSWGELQVHSGDKLEIVHFVGGGVMNGNSEQSGRPLAAACVILRHNPGEFFRR